MKTIATRGSATFLFLSAVGVAEAFYHAWLENAFTTNPVLVNYAPYASFFGVPYWVFGVVWFPVVLVVGLWRTRFGRTPLRKDLLVMLSVGNLFTAYLWFIDLLIIGVFTSAYVGLYATNYALTGLVVAQNWPSPEMRDFLTGTIIGAVIGVFFGAFGVALFGIGGGIVGGIGAYTSKR
jgi:uncharacterized membrane protein